MPVTIRISDEVYLETMNYLVKNTGNDAQTQMKKIFLNEHPFQGGKIEVFSAIITFTNSEDVTKRILGEKALLKNWIFTCKTEKTITRMFAIEYDGKAFYLQGIIPEEDEFWDSPESEFFQSVCLTSFYAAQSKAFRNKKKIFTSKNYQDREHRYEPIVINQPIKIEDGIQIIFSNNTEETRDYIRHIEAWGVRGHERHLKNGKVVFVKPYTKGKGKVKETTYEIT